MIKEALIKKLEGDIEVAKTDLRTFLASPIGVAEHIDYVDTAEKKPPRDGNFQKKNFSQNFFFAGRGLECRKKVRGSFGDARRRHWGCIAAAAAAAAAADFFFRVSL